MRKGLRRIVIRGLRATRPLRRVLARVGPRSLAPRQIHLVWAGDPTRSLGILWQSLSAGSNAYVELRSPGETTWHRHPARTRSAPGPRGWLHHCEIHDLEPDSPYAYRVAIEGGAETARSEVHPIRTAPADRARRVTAAFFADSAVAGRRDGCSEAALRTLDALATEAPLVLLGGGDYVYANTDTRFLDPADAIDAWFEQMEPLFARSIFLPCFGNHEIALGEGYSDWVTRLVLPPGEDASRSHSFDLGAAHFTAIFAPGQAPDQRHLDWLEHDLATARARGARWLIVYQHAPIFAHGRCHPARDDVREALIPIFERHEVDLHLSAHDQSFERTDPERAGEVRQATRIVDGIPTYRAGEGVLYAKISPFGKLSNRGGDFSRLSSTVPAGIVVRNDDCHHHALLHIEADRLEIDVIGVPEEPGPPRRIDRFVIARD